MNKKSFVKFKSPVGLLRITILQNKIIAIEQMKHNFSTKLNPEDKTTAEQVVLALKSYFSGGRQLDLPQHCLLGTDFQKRVWLELRKIPYGRTRTYSDIARRIGSPQSARAVGGACNKNPLLILVPCHRVVASTGQGGFALGAKAKSWLLRLESSANT